jgi:nucleoside-diphosphate-sugar epimerase
MEATLSPLGIRPIVTRLAAGIVGRNNAVDVSRARKELGWESRVSLEEAMEEVERWVREVYIPSRRRK